MPSHEVSHFFARREYSHSHARGEDESVVFRVVLVVVFILLLLLVVVVTTTQEKEKTFTVEGDDDDFFFFLFFASLFGGEFSSKHPGVVPRRQYRSRVVVDEKNSSISRRLFLRRFFVFVVFVFGTTFPTASSSSFIRWRRGGWR